MPRRVALAAGALVAAHAESVFAQKTVSPAHPPDVAAFDIVPTDTSEGSDLSSPCGYGARLGSCGPSISMQT